MGAVFDDSNVYMLHMVYQAMGVCLYMQNLDDAIRYGEKLIKPYRYSKCTKLNKTKLLSLFEAIYSRCDLCFLQSALPTLLTERVLRVSEAGQIVRGNGQALSRS